MNFIEEYKVDEQVCVDLMKYFQKHKEHHNDGTKHRDNDIKVSIDCAVHTSSNNKTLINANVSSASLMDIVINYQF